MREAGLVAVESDAYVPVGGRVCDELERATVEQTRTTLIEDPRHARAERSAPGPRRLGAAGPGDVADDLRVGA